LFDFESGELSELGNVQKMRIAPTSQKTP